MLKTITNETPLLIGLESPYTTIPTKFKYTVTCWFDNVFGVFRSQQLTIKRLFAVGTREGPILIIGDTGEELHRMALLCGHSSEITCISKTFLQDEAFLSISKDGQLCCWSLLDGTCIFSTFLNIPTGKLQINFSPIDPNIIYIWGIGGLVSALDISKKEIIFTLQVYSLLSFTATTNKNLICITNNNIYILDELGNIKSSQKVIPSLTRQYFAQQCGLVSIDGKKVTLRLISHMLFYTGVIEEIEECDSIIAVQWKSPKIAVIVFISGLKLIFTADDNNVVTYQKEHYNTIMLTYASVNSANIIAGINSGSSIVVLEDGKIRELKPNKIGQCVHIPYRNQSKYYISKRSRSILYFNENERKKVFTLSKSKCTAIYSVKVRDFKYVICGTEDGDIFQFNKKTGSLYAMFPALCSRIVGFAPTPFFANGSRRILAIGADGSFCLFNLSDSRINFIGLHFKITSIYVNEVFNFIFTVYDDGSILCFNLDSPDPVGLYTVIPKNCTRVWTYSSTGIVNSGPLSLGYFNNAGYETIFDVIDIQKITKAVLNDEKFKEKCKLILELCNDPSLSPQNQNDLTTSKSTGNLSALSNNNIDNNKEQETKAKTDDNIQNDSLQNNIENTQRKPIFVQNKSFFIRKGNTQQSNRIIMTRTKSEANISGISTSKNFVLIGTNKIPTIIFKPFSVTHSNLYQCSPFTISLYRIACSLIVNTYGFIRNNGFDRPIIECLPTLCDMIFALPSDIAYHCGPLILSIIAKLTSADLLQMIATPLSDCTDPMNLSQSDQLLLLIAATINSKLVPPNFLHPLFFILQNLAKHGSSVNFISYTLLTEGISVWSKETNIVKYYEFLITLLQSDNSSMLSTMLIHSSKVDFQSFLKAFKNVFVKQFNEGINIQNMSNLLTNVSFDSPDGSYGTLLLIKLQYDFNLTNLYQQIEMHASYFKNVDMKDKIIAVGTDNGILTVFSKGKHKFELNIFKSPITNVLIHNDFVIACSLEEKEYAIVSIPSKKITNRMKINKDGTNIDVSIDPSSGHFVVKMT